MRNNGQGQNTSMWQRHTAPHSDGANGGASDVQLKINAQHAAQDESETQPNPDAFDSPVVLLLIAHPLKRERISALLAENGCRCIAAEDEATAIRHVALDPAIGVAIVDAAVFGAPADAIVGTLRRQSYHPLAAILLAPEPSFDLLRQIAQSGPTDILPETPVEEELLAAVRSALDWRQRTQQPDSVPNNVLRMLAQIEARLGVMAAAPHPAQVRHNQAAGDNSANINAGAVAASPAVSAPRVDHETIRALTRFHTSQRRVLGPGLIDDAAWVMLLDLMFMHIERKPLAVTALCMGSGAPVTTALRRLDQLVTTDLVTKTNDPSDRRRVHVSITPKGIECVNAILERIQKELAFIIAA